MQTCSRCRGKRDNPKFRTCSKCRAKNAAWNRSEAKKRANRNWYWKNGGREKQRVLRGSKTTKQERSLAAQKRIDDLALWMIDYAKRTGFVPTIRQCLEQRFLTRPNHVIEVRRQVFGVERFDPHAKTRVFA